MNTRISTSESIKFPFIIIATSEEATKSMEIRPNHNNNTVDITLGKRFKIISDKDTLPYLAIKKAKLEIPEDLESIIITKNKAV